MSDCIASSVGASSGALSTFDLVHPPCDLFPGLLEGWRGPVRSRTSEDVGVLLRRPRDDYEEHEWLVAWGSNDDVSVECESDLLLPLCCLEGRTRSSWVLASGVPCPACRGADPASCGCWCEGSGWRVAPRGAGWMLDPALPTPPMAHSSAEAAVLLGALLRNAVSDGPDIEGLLALAEEEGGSSSVVRRRSVYGSTSVEVGRRCFHGRHDYREGWVLRDRRGVWASGPEVGEKGQALAAAAALESGHALREPGGGLTVLLGAGEGSPVTFSLVEVSACGGCRP